MRTITKLTVSLFVLMLVILSPLSVSAASFEFTVTAKTAFDKMKAAADKTTAAKLTTQYTELQTVQKQDIEWDTKINTLHYRNEEALLSTRKKMKEIDAEALLKLETAVTKTKKDYQPLFAVYDSLNQQLKIAKSGKNKIMIKAVSTQLETTKVAVQLAKLDIKTREAALKAAKTAAANKTKKLRTILSDIDALKVKTKAAKSTVSSTNKSFTTEAAILNQVVRKGEATATQSSLTRLNAFMKAIIEQKQKMYDYEQGVTAIIVKADAQLAIK